MYSEIVVTIFYYLDKRKKNNNVYNKLYYKCVIKVCNCKKKNK